MTYTIRIGDTYGLEDFEKFSYRKTKNERKQAAQGMRAWCPDVGGAYPFPICIWKGSPKGSVCRPTHYVTAKLLRFTIRKDAWLDSSPSPDLRTHVAAPGSQSPRRLPPNGPRRVQDVLPLPDPSDGGEVRVGRVRHLRALPAVHAALPSRDPALGGEVRLGRVRRLHGVLGSASFPARTVQDVLRLPDAADGGEVRVVGLGKIGRASCRERV